MAASECSADSRLITVMPHWIYLRTGLQAVQPPYVADAGAVQDLVDSVPADYAIVGAERNDGGDLMGRYLMPAVRKYPDRWRVVSEDQRPGCACTSATGLRTRRAARRSMTDYRTRRTTVFGAATKRLDPGRQRLRRAGLRAERSKKLASGTAVTRSHKQTDNSSQCESGSLLRRNCAKGLF